MPGILDGVRVLELSQVIAMPFGAMMLADMGADVVKVEPPEGDANRALGRRLDDEESTFFTLCNRGKRSVLCDITDPAQRPLIDALVRWADVVLVAFKAPDVVRYKLSYDDLRALNPRVIAVEMTPYGPNGPFGELGGYDVVVQGMSGSSAIASGQQGDAPTTVRPYFADVGTGVMAALAVSSALYHRERTGEGQRIELSLLSTAFMLGTPFVARFPEHEAKLEASYRDEMQAARQQGEGFAEQQQIWMRSFAPSYALNPYFRYYRTADGFISVGAASPGLYERVRRSVGFDDPRTEAGFEPSEPSSADRLDAMMRSVEAIMATKSTEAWLEIFRASGVPAGPYHFPVEVFDEPQLLENDYVLNLEHPTAGRYQTFAPPIRFGAAPSVPVVSSPRLGEHTDEVRAELGLDG